MIGVLVFTVGDMAQELVESARLIVGLMSSLEALSVSWSRSSLEGLQQEVKTAIERLDTGQGVLMLTDMYGSAP